ncbi:BnaCnng46320D [Brassica napus]|uniref:BnaCnng46320D protein n=1 Tax=Brassica napus TaxID=3708 RepID=A0A078JIU8_BRANA|nr:BnaCnng46320D [Brassica napus]
MDLTDVFIFLFALYFLNLWWRRYSSGRSSQCRLNIPPGPKGWPLVGNLLQVISQRRHFVFLMRDLRKKYGPIFTMQMGQRTMIIVTDEKLIHEALVQRGPTFASRPPDSPIRLMFSVGKCAINSAEYGPLWRTLRRNFVTELVTPTRVKQCSWIRTWAMENHMKRIQKESVEKGYVEVMSQCRLAICSILICLCFGAKISEEKIKNIENVLKDVMLITSPTRSSSVSCR